MAIGAANARTCRQMVGVDERAENKSPLRIRWDDETVDAV